MDTAGLHHLLYAANGPVNQDLDRRANRVLVYQVTHVNVETGRTRAGLHVEKTIAADGSPARKVGGSGQGLIAQEFGTGLYGPARRRIVPKTAKALHWKDGSGEHFARSVKGQRPHPFIRPSLQAARD